MRSRMRRCLLLALFIAGSLVAAPTASASKLSLSATLFTVTWREFVFTDTSGSPSTRCPVTLEGEFHSATFAKSEGALIGLITRASVGSCSTGTIIWLTARLPWHIKFDNWTGTLPNITSVRIKIIDVSWRWNIFPFKECLYRSEASHPVAVQMFRNTGTSQITNFAPVETAFYSIPNMSIDCTDELWLSGTGTMTRANSGEGIFLYLIR
jgi:hypothetical protein